MKIAVDYDETYTSDPKLFELFVLLAKERGHEVKFVTYRQAKWGNDDIHADAEYLDIDVIFTEGRQKQHVYDADIWIDDSPVTIPRFTDLGDIYDGCLANNDCE